MKLNTALKNRWSPRSFSEKEVINEMIDLLFEAARWAPSAMNEQPWKYYYIHRSNQKKFNDVVELLTGKNPLWAQHAQVLIISVVKKNYDYQSRPNKNALHDLGAANVSIAIQATEMGLQAHQMGGFDKAKLSDYLYLDTDNFEPFTIIAIGFPGAPEQLPDDLKQLELQPRKRKELTEFVTML